ncbi:DUF871 family protein [Virgibacillus pantothenticus]|uniref:DUF871 domain-containing protein n=1 Tax=Virgibacillus pantothenticus TaxID=1473 RepID=UPI001C2186E2|nr:MupG family TIM beta-alpha barrel fold protein [Virgibacillus pantothenticus]MBU8565602.1 DUF871 family protein [Virgibacillus pantothenticus]MBU8599900.1 DUF871 family protein [Virgibacillus pantothenticus]MBU8634347.1 DUF871 family protein [Virgibacillus pantothenticus]MBU8641643.1 DUF871 family protein [Virgibacillus pantothenticus]MBU8647815.1 DUF871 family protein [Virgibacillus pantothenticus]
MLGISVYIGMQNLEEQVAYLKKMKANGFHSIFTSLHIPEDDPTKYKNQLQALAKLARELNMELVADISPTSLSALGFDWETASELLNWGLTGLRVDYGIDEDIIVRLSKQMKIALNASTLTPAFLDNLILKGLDISSVEAWHNYYPRPETGLGWGDFINQNKWLKEAGLSIMAFIPGDDELRGPLYETLPTLEAHRSVSPFVAYLDLVNKGMVDKILIGDSGVSSKVLEQFSAYQRNEILLHAVPGTEVSQTELNLVKGTHTNRVDRARDCIRSVESRHYASVGALQIPAANCRERPAGSITIDNQRYKRYQGEIQITTRDLPKDKRVNVIGRVVPEELMLLRWIVGGQKFTIRWV